MVRYAKAGPAAAARPSAAPSDADAPRPLAVAY